MVNINTYTCIKPVSHTSSAPYRGGTSFSAGSSAGDMARKTRACSGALRHAAEDHGYPRGLRAASIARILCANANNTSSNLFQPTEALPKPRQQIARFQIRPSCWLLLRKRQHQFCYKENKPINYAAADISRCMHLHIYTHMNKLAIGTERIGGKSMPVMLT